MSPYHSTIFIHAIWSNMGRFPKMHTTDEQLIYRFLKGALPENGLPIKAIYGMTDHIPVLLFLNPQKSLTEIFKQAKGNSFHPIHLPNRSWEKFSWQTASAPIPSSGTPVEKETQKERASKKFFHSKYSLILKDHGLDMEI